MLSSSQMASCGQHTIKDSFIHSRDNIVKKYVEMLKNKKKSPRKLHVSNRLFARFLVALTFIGLIACHHSSSSKNDAPTGYQRIPGSSSRSQKVTVGSNKSGTTQGDYEL